MPKVFQRELARRDLMEHFVYLAENAGLTVAEQFLANAEESFNELALNPLMGAPLTLGKQDFTGIRKWRVNDFDNTLIFYMPRHNGISIVRVLHAAQDWWNLLESI
jgi:toxin ParE1/3/4